MTASAMPAAASELLATLSRTEIADRRRLQCFDEPAGFVVRGNEPLGPRLRLALERAVDEAHELEHGLSGQRHESPPRPPTASPATRAPIAGRSPICSP